MNMTKSQRGDSTAEAIFIISIVVGYTMLSWLAVSMDYTTSALGDFSSWTLPTVSNNLGILSYFVDFFSIIINMLLWVIYTLATFGVLVGFSVTGNGIPVWIAAITITPLGIGMVWLIFNGVRGRG